MPDKPKRRKNNRNKRKNKGQNQLNNNTNISQSTTANVNENELCTEKSLTPANSGISSNAAASPTQEISSISEDISATKSVDNLQNPKNNDNICQDNITANDNSDTNDLQIETPILQDIKKDEKSLRLNIYKVESPEKVLKNKTKLKTEVKSKSLDNEDEPTIVEITDEGEKDEINRNVVVVEASNIQVTEIDSDVEWEKTTDLKDVNKQDSVPGTLSITTIPLNVAQCDQMKSMSPDEERNLRTYLQTLNLSTNSNTDTIITEVKTETEQINEHEIKHRMKHKALTDNSFSTRLGPPRSLHVIDEEVSGESSATSRRHSYLNEKKSDNEELEDDVFLPPDEKICELRIKREARTFSNLIPQKCIRVGAQIKDPEIEARGDWTTEKLETITGAEIVYLTDSSSSTSSSYDINESEENIYNSDENVRIITPTIEVTNTDNYLKNNFTSKLEDSKQENKTKNAETGDATRTLNNENFMKEIKTVADHEIVVIDANSINTNLYVKDMDEANTPLEMGTPATSKIDSSETGNDLKIQKNNVSNITNIDKYDLEIKVLKCELNNAINNLIKEVASDSESATEDTNEPLIRQDSSSSVGSSQCTAKYNPKVSSLNDLPGTESDEYTKGIDFISTDNISHVKDVIQTISDKNCDETLNKEKDISLRNLCLQKISKLPYGEQILEELANVSERLQKISDAAMYSSNTKQITREIMNYDDIQNKSTHIHTDKISPVDKISIPPPIQPRNSSLKISHEDPRTIAPTHTISKNNERNILPTSNNSRICLSPSQKMLMEKTKTTLQNTSEIQSLPYKENVNKIHNSPMDDKDVDVKFKSQTGSRLLALLRDPLSKEKDSKNIHEFNKKNTSDFNSYSKTNLKDNAKENINLEREVRPLKNENLSLFKPIPPPKPRKYSSSFYECDQSSTFADNSFKTIRSENKYLHYSTGNLNKDIEDDISSIQNMHRHYNDIYRKSREEFYPRRPSLPKDLCDKQMEYILQKEKEVEAEIFRLENDRIKNTERRGPRAPMIRDTNIPSKSEYDLRYIKNRNNSYHNINSIGTRTEPVKLSSAFSKSQEELIRQKMYTEYVTQMSEREERKQQKVIKISKIPYTLTNTYSKSEKELNIKEHKINNNRIEKEFIDRARERWNKLGFKDPETEDERESDKRYREPQVIEHKIKVIDSGEEKDVQKLPSHLQDFVKFTVKDKSDKSGSPGESDTAGASSHGVIVCAVIILLLTITKYILRLFR